MRSCTGSTLLRLLLLPRGLLGDFLRVGLLGDFLGVDGLLGDFLGDGGLIGDFLGDGGLIGDFLGDDGLLGDFLGDGGLLGDFLGVGLTSDFFALEFAFVVLLLDEVATGVLFGLEVEAGATRYSASMARSLSLILQFLMWIFTLFLEENAFPHHWQ